MRANHPLLKIAQSQSGLFTSQQAVSTGMDSRNHSYHLKVGNWSKEGKGIYRLNLIQEENSRKKFFFLQLLMRSKRGELVGAFSYETALYLMGFKIDTPDPLHITVPSNFRKNISEYEVIIHYENLNPPDRIEKNNLYITSIEKTFQDLISTESYHPEWIKKQFKTAIEENIISTKELKTIKPPKKISDKRKRILKAILFELL